VENIMKKLIPLAIVLLALSTVLTACWAEDDYYYEGTEEANTQATEVTEAAMCSDDSCINQCMANVTDTMGYDANNYLDQYYDVNESYDLVTYDADDGQLGEGSLSDVPADFIDLQEDDYSQQLVWDLTMALLPEEDLRWITQYLVFTDGTDNDLAYVIYDDDLGRSAWTLGVDLVDASDPETLTGTLIHEFAHMITLNTDQIAEGSEYGWEQGTDDCETFYYYYGCTYEDSYVNQFYLAFWQDIFPDWKEIVGDPSADLEEYDEDAVTEFYNLYSDQFIDDYAPTEIGEDIAESFESFVVQPMPTGDTIPEQKILFFYQFPELVELRQTMIQGMCNFQG
jgi:hypothetical protein